MKYIVTGGAGFIGSHLVDRLLADNHEVVVIDNFSLGKEENLIHHQGNQNLQVIRRSAADNLDDIFQQHKFAAVFHLAALPRVQFSIQNPLLTHQANVNSTCNLLDTCRRLGVKRFIYASSCAVYGDQDVLPFTEDMTPRPLSPYALHKWVGEQYCALHHRLYGLETIALRYFNVYGLRQSPEGDYACLIPRFIKFIAQGQTPTINGDGNQTRDFTFVGDIMEANLAALRAGPKAFGKVFNIGNGKNYSVNDITSMLLKVFNSSIKPKYGPAVVEPHDALADISLAQQLLGWQPQANIEQELATIVAGSKF